MRRVNALLRHPTFTETLSELEALEQERIFCRHGLSHLLDVARIMWIQTLEQGLPLDKEVVYAAALLHDLGRVAQLRQGTPHEEASAALAGAILPECSYTEGETAEISAAILSHRGETGGPADGTPLGRLLYEADKKSRVCWCCKAQRLCNWPEAKRNTGIDC
ncbi:MAG: HD domain-containing protein [Clostridiales bacterium]|nr:HD domain-containing protein [Clostridiales bacterium]